MATVLVESYLTNLRLTLQTAEYTRVTELPKLSDLGEYIRIRNNGNIEKFAKDPQSELLVGEILILRTDSRINLATVYRCLKPSGRLVKHTYFDVSKYWDIFTALDNYSKEHVDISIQELAHTLETNPLDFDIQSAVRDLWIVYRQALQRVSTTNSDRDILLLDTVLELKDKIYIRLANGIKNETVGIARTSLAILQLETAQYQKILQCPWITADQIYHIGQANTVDEYAYTSTEVANYSNFIKMLYIKSEDGDVAITENKIFSISDGSELNPRFFDYVK